MIVWLGLREGAVGSGRTWPRSVIQRKIWGLLTSISRSEPLTAAVTKVWDRTALWKESNTKMLVFRSIRKAVLWILAAKPPSSTPPSLLNGASLKSQELRAPCWLVGERSPQESQGPRKDCNQNHQKDNLKDRQSDREHKIRKLRKGFIRPN